MFVREPRAFCDTRRLYAVFDNRAFLYLLSINPSLPKRREDLATTAYNRRYNLHFAKRGRRRRNRGLVRKGQNERTATPTKSLLSLGGAKCHDVKFSALQGEHPRQSGPPRRGSIKPYFILC